MELKENYAKSKGYVNWEDLVYMNIIVNSEVTACDNIIEHEDNINEVLISELKETITDLLCIQGSIYDACKTDKRWEGIYEIIQKQIDIKKELIK